VWLQKLGIKASKATSDESKEAQLAIKKFKKSYNYGDAKAVDALVTVAMAYEGLDVPAITHVACLTHIRSKPWLEQSWARAARVDREAGNLKKTGLIYLPDDQLAKNCVEAIIAEQQPILRERELNRRDNDNGGNGDNDAKSKEPRYNSSIALSSNLTRSRASDLSSGETVD
jgi:superfamily II DNA or RNA helicase